jgi:hypothetical protein
LNARVKAGTPAALPVETVCVPKLSVVAALLPGETITGPVNVFAALKAYTEPPAVLWNVIPPEPLITPENVTVGAGAARFATAPVTTIVLLSVIGLAIVNVAVAAGSNCTVPPLTVNVPVPRAELLAIWRLPAVRFTPPAKVFAPPSRITLPVLSGRVPVWLISNPLLPDPAWAMVASSCTAPIPSPSTRSVVPLFSVTPVVLVPFWTFTHPEPTCQMAGSVSVEDVSKRSVLAAVEPESEIGALDPAELPNTMLFRSKTVSNCEVYPPADWSGELLKPRI